MLACPSISGGHAGVPLHWLRSCRLAHPLVDCTYPFMDDFCPLYAGLMHVCVCVCVCVFLYLCVYGCVCWCVGVHSWILFRLTKIPDVKYFSPVPAYLLLLSTTPEQEGVKNDLWSMKCPKIVKLTFIEYLTICHKRKWCHTIWMHQKHPHKHTLLTLHQDMAPPMVLIWLTLSFPCVAYFVFPCVAYHNLCLIRHTQFVPYVAHTVHVLYQVVKLVTNQ